MAKGSAQGLWRGKKGTSVFYKIKNSNNAQKQGIRERVYEISNPQSNGQASQRMKMLPAQRLANVLKNVIERGFEGIEYGVKSRQEFLKYALAMTEGYPATDKNATQVFPGKYLISHGTLPKVTGSWRPNSTAWIIDLTVENFETRTVAYLSQQLLNNNPWLALGDQLTFITASIFDVEDFNDTPILWNVASMYIDTSDTSSFDDLELANIFNYEDGTGLILSSGNLDFLVAAAVIVSRESDTGGHMRSSTTLAVSPKLNNLFTNEAYARARRTYQKQNAQVVSDWPLEPGDVIGGVTVTDGVYTLSGLTGDKATANGTIVKVKVAEETGDLKGVYIISDPQSIFNGGLVDVNGNPVQYVDYTDPEQGLVTGLKPADVPALAELPTVIWRG